MIPKPKPKRIPKPKFRPKPKPKVSDHQIGFTTFNTLIKIFKLLFTFLYLSVVAIDPKLLKPAKAGIVFLDNKL